MPSAGPLTSFDVRWSRHTEWAYYFRRIRADFAASAIKKIMVGRSIGLTMIFILKQGGLASVCRPVLPTSMYWFYRQHRPQP